MGIKDYSYASLFDKKDLPYLYRLAEKVRATHNQDLVNDFNNNLERKWNDHNPILGDNIEILQTSKADDLVVTTGINQCIDLILGTSIISWEYMYEGSGTTAPAIGQTALITPQFLVSMILFGWREYAGTSLRFAGIFGESPITHTVNEAGVFIAGLATMLNRNTYSYNPIIHTINTTAYVISSVVEFVPVV